MKAIDDVIFNRLGKQVIVIRTKEIFLPRLHPLIFDR